MQAGDAHSWYFHFLESISRQTFQVEKQEQLRTVNGGLLIALFH